MLGGKTSCALSPSAVAQRSSSPEPFGFSVRSGFRRR
jgi:hypothetical protein